MKQLLTKTKLISVFFLALFVGCENNDNELLPEILSSFTFIIDEDTGTVEFINLSEEASSYSWDFGDGTASVEINPIKVYGSSGTYNVVLTVTNSAGATSTFETEVTVNIPEPPTPLALPIDFDGADVDYGVVVGDNIGFSVVANPENGNGNETNVGQLETGGGQFQNVQFPLAPAVDFSGDNKTIELELFSSTEIAVLVKFEDGAGARDVEVGATHTGSGWETLSFDFATDAVASFIEGDPLNGQSIVPDGQFSKMILFIGFNTDPGVEGTFYVDNIEQSESDPGGGGGGGGSLDDCGGDLVNDFETADDSIFANFGGGVGTIIDNPDTSVNTSAKVGQYVKNTGEVFGGITIEVDPDIDFDAGVFSIDVYSVAVRQLLFKLEGLNIEVIVATAGTGWETITYDFSSVVGNVGSATAITLIMDNGTAGDGSADWTIQFDNIRLCSNNAGGGGGGNTLDDCGGDLVNDFETADDSIFANFGGGVGTIIDNPDTSVNTSAKVGQYVKNTGEVFGGITIEVDPDIDFDAGVFSIDVYSVAVRQLLFKLEGLNIEVIVATAGTGWETITYDFSSVVGNVGSATAITLIMDNGTAGDGSADWTIQFDNIRLCSNNAGGGGGGNTLDDCGGDLVNDFETADDSIFANFGGGVGTIIDNPDTSVNTSAKVGQYVKNTGEVFGGITIEVDPDIDFDAGVFSIDVYSVAVRQLLFKLEGLNIEVIVATAGTGWETITYDFSSVVGNVGSATAITLIMDNGTAGDGSADWTIQFDNIRLCSNNAGGGGGGGGGGELAVNGDFETGDDTGWFIFQNGGTAALDNTLNNGGTWSGRLTVGDTGGNPAFKQERIGSGTVAAGDTVQVQFDYIGSIMQPGAIVNVLLFGEGAGGVSFTQSLAPGPNPGGTWTQFTGTYEIPGGTDVSEGISVLIETVCGAVAGCNVVMNIDNVSVTLNP